jgi:hypothetical protein
MQGVPRISGGGGLRMVNTTLSPSCRGVGAQHSGVSMASPWWLCWQSMAGLTAAADVLYRFHSWHVGNGDEEMVVLRPQVSAMQGAPAGPGCPARCELTCGSSLRAAAHQLVQGSAAGQLHHCTTLVV